MIERNSPLSTKQQADLDVYRKELARILKAKEEYVKLHPEERATVFKRDNPSGNSREKRGGDGEQQQQRQQGADGGGARGRGDGRFIGQGHGRGRGGGGMGGYVNLDMLGLRFDKKGQLLNP